MASVRDDDYSRLAQSVDDWVAELSQARSALAQSLNVRQSQRPAFRLSGGDTPPSNLEPFSQAEASERRPQDEIQALLLARIAESERNARDAQLRLDRTEAELEFAREQLHLQNRLRAESEEKWAASEREREATVHALGHTQISLDELRRQLRGKEWALENAKGDLDEEPETAAASRQAVDDLQREAAALQSRLDALTVELEDAREQSAREQEAAAAAEQRRKHLELEAEHSREIVEELSREVERYADELRRTGRELDETRDVLAHGVPVGQEGAVAESSIDEGSLALQYSERRIDELTAALNAAERSANERLSETSAEAAELSDNYDALAASHMELREHVAALQQEIVARDHELAGLRDRIAGSAEIPRDAEHVMNTELAEVVESLESDAVGNAYLVQALRRELEAARESLDQSQTDQRLLTRALRAEIEGLRAIAAERDFVIHHQETQLEATLLGAQVIPATVEAPDMEALNEELSVLRQRLEDKDAIVRRLRSQLAESEARAASAGSEGVDELRTVIRHREADLERTRDRVNFLRRALRDLQFDKPLKQLETTSDSSQNTPKTDVSVKRPNAPARKFVDIDSEIDPSRYQANASLQREVEQSLALQSAWPVMAIMLGLAGFGMLALAVLAFLIR